MKDDTPYLAHIHECLERIERYASGGRDSFFSDTLIQDAVIRNLQTLAESSRRLSSTLQEEHREIDWKNIAGLRNVLVHDYLGLDLEQIWLIVETDLPPLRCLIENLLEQQ